MSDPTTPPACETCAAKNEALIDLRNRLATGDHREALLAPCPHATLAAAQVAVMDYLNTAGKYLYESWRESLRKGVGLIAYQSGPYTAYRLPADPTPAPPECEACPAKNAELRRQRSIWEYRIGVRENSDTFPEAAADERKQVRRIDEALAIPCPHAVPATTREAGLVEALRRLRDQHDITTEALGTKRIAPQLARLRDHIEAVIALASAPAPGARLEAAEAPVVAHPKCAECKDTGIWRCRCCGAYPCVVCNREAHVAWFGGRTCSDGDRNPTKKMATVEDVEAWLKEWAALRAGKEAPDVL